MQRRKCSRLTDRQSTKYDGRVLPLYSRPEVKIRIGSAVQEYTLPKALLCEQVPYFKGIFKEEQFKEGLELSATLPEEDEVVSTRSFEMLVQ